MSTLYSTYVCSGCNTTFPVAQRCPKCAPLTEERVREITREEILRAVETHDADAEIRRQARDEALEEAAVWFLNCKTDTVCEGEAGEWIEEKISARQFCSNGFHAPKAEQPSAAWTEHVAEEITALRKERDDWQSKYVQTHVDRNALEKERDALRAKLAAADVSIADLIHGREQADREYQEIHKKLAAAEKALDGIAELASQFHPTQCKCIIWALERTGRLGGSKEGA